MVCIVLPMPISSARMPPLIGPASLATIQPRPSSWNESSGRESAAGVGSRGIGSAGLQCAGSSGSISSSFTASLLVSSSRTRSRCSDDSWSSPWISRASCSLDTSGTRRHAGCCQEEIQPYSPPRHLMGTPTRGTPLGMSSLHLLVIVEGGRERGVGTRGISRNERKKNAVPRRRRVVVRGSESSTFGTARGPS